MGTFCKQGSKEAENRPNKSPEGGVQLDIFKISGHFIAYKNFLTMSTCPLLNAQHLAYCPLLIVHCCPLLITHCSILGSLLIAHCPLLNIWQTIHIFSLRAWTQVRCLLQQWQVGSVIRFCANWHSGGLQWQSELYDVERPERNWNVNHHFPGWEFLPRQGPVRQKAQSMA